MIASNRTTAAGSKPVGMVMSSPGRDPYEVAASERMERGVVGSNAVLVGAAVRGGRARSAMRMRFCTDPCRAYQNDSLWKRSPSGGELLHGATPRVRRS